MTISIVHEEIFAFRIAQPSMDRAAFKAKAELAPSQPGFLRGHGVELPRLGSIQEAVMLLLPFVWATLFVAHKAAPTRAAFLFAWKQARGVYTTR
jgi:hypothetical protein